MGKSDAERKIMHRYGSTSWREEFAEEHEEEERSFNRMVSESEEDEVTLDESEDNDETEGSCYEPGEPYNDRFDREMANEPFTEDEKELMETRLHYSLEELSMNRERDPKP